MCPRRPCLPEGTWYAGFYLREAHLVRFKTTMCCAMVGAGMDTEVNKIRQSPCGAAEGLQGAEAGPSPSLCAHPCHSRACT